MTLRVVLAVVLAAALCTAAVPAVHDARRANAETAGSTAADSVRDAVRALTSSTPAPVGAPAATRVVRLALPRRGTATAGAALFVGTAPGPPGASDTQTTDLLAVRVAGRIRVVRLPVDLRVQTNGTVEPDGTGIRVTHRAALRLRYVRYRGRPTVVATAGDGADLYTRGRDHRGT